MTITPSVIVTGTMLAQIFVLVIMFIAGMMIVRDYSLVRWYSGQPSHAKMGWLLLALALITLIPLILSDAITGNWRPLFGSFQFGGIKWSTSVFFVFLVDILTLTILVYNTGGSVRSPFQPLYFLFPTLALFLHESTGRVVTYGLLIAISFLSLLFAGQEASEEDQRSRTMAYGFVSIACLCVACFIGVYTRSV